MPAHPLPPSSAAAEPFPGGAGDDARERLLTAGLQLFAEQGYAKTSIRQIAHAAGTNVAAVSYYFGNKAGLYRAACGCGGGSGPTSPPVALPLASLDALFHGLLAPLRSGGRARVQVKMLRREMIEPSGLWQERVDRGMRPLHAALVAWLCERLGVAAPDDGIQVLATLVVAPAVHLLLNCELIDLLAPSLLDGDAAVDAWCGRLCRNAELLIADEARARAAVPAPAPSSPRSPA